MMDRLGLDDSGDIIFQPYLPVELIVRSYQEASPECSKLLNTAAGRADVTYIRTLYKDFYVLTSVINN